jgi:putative effector of murein hydrolase
MAGPLDDGVWNTRYDKFLALSSWINAVFYAAPAAVVLAVCWYLQIPERFWTYLLIIYFVGAVAHLLTYGFQAVNAQIKTSSDHALEQLVLLMTAQRSK